MIPIPRDFRDFIRLLNEQKVKYIVVGGYAVAFHGYPRATGDLDIFVELNRENAEAMVKVFEAFGFPVGEIKPELFMDPGHVVRLSREPMKLEILNEITGAAFSECHENRIVAEVEGVNGCFINLPELVKNKQSTGRAKDAADLENL